MEKCLCSSSILFYSIQVFFFSFMIILLVQGKSDYGIIIILQTQEKVKIRVKTRDISSW